MTLIQLGSENKTDGRQLNLAKLIQYLDLT